MFAAQCTRETRRKQMQEISLCICPVVVVVTIFSWRCPRYVTATQSSAHSLLPWCLKPPRCRASSAFVFLLEGNLGCGRAGRMKDSATRGHAKGNKSFMAVPCSTLAVSRGGSGAVAEPCDPAFPEFPQVLGSGQALLCWAGHKHRQTMH